MTGLVIGRFQPFHLGHLSIVERIIAEKGWAKIGIGSSQYDHHKDNPFTADERERMIRAALSAQTDYEIFRVPDLHDEVRWVAHVKGIVGRFDSVYSDNETTIRLFREAGDEVVEHEKFRGINARDIRALMIKDDSAYLDLIPPEVASILEDIDGVGRLQRVASR